jgi:hypothetical protein
MAAWGRSEGHTLPVWRGSRSAVRFVVLNGVSRFDLGASSPKPWHTLGYRHRFGFITLNFTKPLGSMYLGVSEIRLNLAYFHRLTALSRNLKSVGTTPWGQLPLPAPTLHSI